MGFLTELKKNLINIPGSRIKRKIVLIESDDWGSIRMPNQKTYQRLEEEGYQPNLDPYLKYDSLASESDLNELFSVLESFKDSNGNHPVITANTIVANPDFDRIRQSNFEQYYYEDFTETLNKYEEHANSFQVWQQGIAKNVFKPQYHGREHINIFQWMGALKRGDELVHKAFENKMISISSMDKNLRFSYMESLDFFSKEERLQKSDIIIDGHRLFKEKFGYQSYSFIANCYIWDQENEKTLNKEGIKLIQGIANQIIPKNMKSKHSYTYKKHYMGQWNDLGQKYLIRNCFFEPSINPKENIVEECLYRIQLAFRWNKPAIIGSHRLNYIGFINETNRERNLQLLKTLIRKIIRRWPDVEFMSTDQLKEIYFGKA